MPKPEMETKIRTWQILFTPSDEIVDRAINILSFFQDLLILGDYKIQNPEPNDQIPFWSIFLVTDKKLEDIEDALIFVLDYCRINLIANFNIFEAGQIQAREKLLEESFQHEQPIPEEEKSKLTGFKLQPEAKQVKIDKITTNRINVDAAKLDHLMFLVSELVTTKSELMLSIELNDLGRITESAQKIDKLSKLFRDNALDTRLISMQDLIMRFNRLIRDLSNSLGKKVDFVTQGEDIELDKNIIDCIGEPIMHLLRNCLDHGIEMPDDRAEANKPETGTIKFFAYKSGNFVFIQISDDGRGIDREKVRAKAIDKGLIDENAQLSNADVYNLIFLPGFSTAENLTQVSGRGVGMDIVRKRIQEIRGEVTVDSEPGLGTSFTLKLQQTISILDTLLVIADTSKFAIPIEEIEHCQIIATDLLNLKQNKHLTFQDQLVPYISLREEFSASSDLPEKQRFIIVNKNEKRFAIIVDDIIGEYQAVVKNIGETFTSLDFISGASILGDGSIALLLDSDKLKKLVSHQ